MFFWYRVDCLVVFWDICLVVLLKSFLLLRCLVSWLVFLVVVNCDVDRLGICWDWLLGINVCCYSGVVVSLFNLCWIVNFYSWIVLVRLRYWVGWIDICVCYCLSCCWWLENVVCLCGGNSLENMVVGFFCFVLIWRVGYCLFECVVFGFGLV